MSHRGWRGSIVIQKGYPRGWAHRKKSRAVAILVGPLARSKTVFRTHQKSFRVCRTHCETPRAEWGLEKDARRVPVVGAKSSLGFTLRLLRYLRLNILSSFTLLEC